MQCQPITAHLLLFKLRDVCILLLYSVHRLVFSTDTAANPLFLQRAEEAVIKCHCFEESCFDFQWLQYLPFILFCV